MNRPPSLSKIAAKAGVAKSTVSLALRNDPRVKAALAERIRKIAGELGYTQNALLGQLMHELRQSRKQAWQATFALINVSQDPFMMKHSVVQQRLAGAKERAAQLGYSLDCFDLHSSGITPTHLAKILHNRGIQGVAFYGYDDGAAVRACESIWQRLPSITIGSRVRNPALHFVSNDQYFTAFQACSQLRQLGYKRIGVIQRPSANTKLDCRFVGGFHSRPELHDAVIPLYLELPYNEEGRNQLHNWLHAFRPDVIMGVGGSAFIQWIRETGLRIPEDIGVALLDIQPEMKGTAAGMDQQNIRLGMTAIDVLVAQVHRHQPGIPPFQQGTLIESIWVPGPTIRPFTKKGNSPLEMKRLNQ